MYFAKIYFVLRIVTFSHLHDRRLRGVPVRLELNGIPAHLRAGSESLRFGSVRHSMGVSAGDNR